MLGIDSEQDSNLTGGDIIRADEQRRMDAATLGYSISQERVPLDTGTLKKTGFQPENRDGDIVFGYTAPYAQAMEEGTEPYYPPIQPLLEWADRIGAGPGLAYYVARHKIPTEGITAQPYLAPSAERMDDWLSSHSLEEYL